MADRCAWCNVTLGTLTQGVLPGSGVELLCPGCQRNKRAGHILALLPDPEDDEYDELTEWEQEFLVSVREQYERRKSVTEKQADILERIYAKVD